MVLGRSMFKWLQRTRSISRCTKPSTFLGLTEVKDNGPTPSLLLLVLSTQLKEKTTTKLLEIVATDGLAKARLLPWEVFLSFITLRLKITKHTRFKIYLLKPLLPDI